MKENYVYFLKKLKDSYHQYGVCIIAYCLMPNHYHFLFRQDTDQPLSDWLRKLFNGYVQAVNKQQKRSGTLFQGRPKHIWIDKETYLIHVIRYIHYNPVEAGLVKTPENWKYSNYPEWIGIRKGTIIDRDFARNYFPNPDNYRHFMEHYAINKQFTKELEIYLLKEA